MVIFYVAILVSKYNHYTAYWRVFGMVQLS
jgi:hypothetical protein